MKLVIDLKFISALENLNNEEIGDAVMFLMEYLGADEEKRQELMKKLDEGSRSRQVKIAIEFLINSQPEVKKSGAEEFLEEMLKYSPSRNKVGCKGPFW